MRIILGILCIAAGLIVLLITAFLFCLRRRHEKKRSFLGYAALGVFILMTGLAQIIPSYTEIFAYITAWGGGIWLAVLGIDMLIAPFRYSVRGEGKYIGEIYDHTSHGRYGSSYVYYAMKFQFATPRRRMTKRSSDVYGLWYIKWKMTAGQTYTIWFNRKDPTDFRVKRFKDFIYGFPLTAAGLFLMAFPVFAMLRT